LRAPLKQARERRRLEALARSFARQEGAPICENGMRAAVGAFSAQTGLGRAAAYEMARLRQELGAVAAVDLADPSAVWTGGPVSELYLLCLPDAFPDAFARFTAETLAGARRTALWVWETPHFPQRWAPAFRLVDAVWTPSNFSARAIEAAAAGRIPVTVRPHPVMQRPTTADAPAAWAPPDVFLGAAIMDLSVCPARKNPWAHVATWRAAFGDDPNAQLILKIRLSRRTVVVRNELRRMVGDSPAFRLIEDDLDESALDSLIRRADVVLSLHRAEGFGLVMAEAHGMGRPVVATGWSGVVDCLRGAPGFHAVAWRPAPYRDWLGVYSGASFTWAEADVASAVAALREVRAAAEWRRQVV
jgi:hypothetical protein